MNLRSLAFTLLTCMATLSSQTLFADSDTRELRRELIKLHGDISMSAGSLLLLAQQNTLNPVLKNSNNATVLAALEVMNRTKFTGQESTLKIGPDNIRAARNKIEIYKMLCMSAKQHNKIFDKYCSPPPYNDLYTGYSAFAAKQ